MIPITGAVCLAAALRDSTTRARLWMENASLTRYRDVGACRLVSVLDCAVPLVRGYFIVNGYKRLSLPKNVERTTGVYCFHKKAPSKLSWVAEIRFAGRKR